MTKTRGPCGFPGQARWERDGPVDGAHRARGQDGRAPPGGRASGFVAYSSEFDDLPQRAAGYVYKILEGAKPAELPVERPTRFKLVINLRTAKALGLTIPPSLLARADQVIE